MGRGRGAAGGRDRGQQRGGGEEGQDGGRTARVPSPEGGGGSGPSSVKWGFGFRRSRRSVRTPKRVGLNGGSAARRGREEERSRREQSKGEKRRAWRDGARRRRPAGSGNGLFLHSLPVAVTADLVALGGCAAGDPGPHPPLTSGGGQTPLLQPRTPLGAQRPGGAAALSVSRVGRAQPSPALRTALPARTRRPPRLSGSA